jgi:sulfoxide reductase catalytic subunit YedY
MCLHSSQFLLARSMQRWPNEGIVVLPRAFYLRGGFVMMIRIARGWEIPESKVTPETLVLGRRRTLGLGLGGALATFVPQLGHTQQSVPRNQRYDPGRPITPAQIVTTYNNFYEFGSDKDIWQAAQALPMHPWVIHIEGLVSKPLTIAVDDLLKQVPLEERVYRHRCVEAWAMTVPWTGFPVGALIKLAAPLSSARYVAFQSLVDAKYMPGVAEPFFPWPYVEGLTIEEANNELAFIATGLYGKPLPPQNGGPIRLVVPWKYGFKSAKSLAKITFTDRRPQTFWETVSPQEYGFWANVNPEVSHPRWSQATERLLGSDERVPTQIYNGYGEWVAGLYANKKDKRLFM